MPFKFYPHPPRPRTPGRRDAFQLSRPYPSRWSLCYPARMSREVEAVALYPKRQGLFAGYPEFEPEGVRHALECAAQSLDERVTPLEPA